MKYLISMLFIIASHVAFADVSEGYFSFLNCDRRDQDLSEEVSYDFPDSIEIFSPLVGDSSEKTSAMFQLKSKKPIPLIFVFTQSLLVKGTIQTETKDEKSVIKGSYYENREIIIKLKKPTTGSNAQIFGTAVLTVDGTKKNYSCASARPPAE